MDKNRATMRNNVITGEPDEAGSFNRFINMLRQLEYNSQNNNQPQERGTKETSLITTNIPNKEQPLPEEEPTKLRGSLPQSSKTLEFPGFWKSEPVVWSQKADYPFKNDGIAENNMKSDYGTSTLDERTAHEIEETLRRPQLTKKNGQTALNYKP